MVIVITKSVKMDEQLEANAN